jgi:glycosyltransferase involved in cell wall biosynthesis
MTEGNGAIVAHRYLESGIPDYRVKGLGPITALLGPGLKFAFSVPEPTRLIHSVPDLACFFQQPGLPSVVSFQNYVLDSEMVRYSSIFQQIYYRTALRAYHQRSVAGADLLTAVSHYTATIASQDLGIDKPIEVIHNGVDHRLFTPAVRRQRGARLRVLFSGNPSLRKGVQFLPEIARGLPRDVELLVASGLRGQSTESAGHPDIQQLGSVPFTRMPDLYRSVDLALRHFFARV